MFHLSSYFLQNSGNGEYVTDTGLVVPAIALSLRDRLMAAAEARGFSRDRITELVSEPAKMSPIDFFKRWHLPGALLV